jgi:hypothetical protein
MKRGLWRWVAAGIIFLFLGSAIGGAVVWAIPNEGSPPSIFDAFSYSSTSSGYWHVDPIGAQAIIKNGTMTLVGNSIELDHRIQTDPYSTVAVARVRALSFDKLAVGLGLYHSGTISFEFDSDGAKCGRGTDVGWAVDYVKSWVVPPVGQWFYVGIKIKNPYPNPSPALLAKLSNEDPSLWKPVTITCALWDSAGHILAQTTPTTPRPNTHYASLDEAYLRTWDDKNRYQIDWFYAGPPSAMPFGLRFGS